MKDNDKTQQDLIAELETLRRRVTELESAWHQKDEEHRQLLTAEREQRAFAEALTQTGAALASTLRREQVLDRVLEELSRVVTYDAACIILIDGDMGHIFRWRGYTQYGALDFISSDIADIAEIPILQEIRETHRPQAVPRVNQEDAWILKPGREWVQSYAVAPIISRGRVIGLLNIDSETHHFVDEADAKYLQGFADQAAIGLENAWLYDRARHEIAWRVKALKKERNFVSAILDTIDALVVVFDSNGRIVRFNKACEKAVGYLSDDVKGRLFWELFLIPEEIEVVKTAFRTLQAGQSLSKHKSYLKTRGGNRRLVEWTNTVVRSNSDALEYIISTGLDISTQQQTKRALKENEQKYRSFTDQLPVGVYRTTEDGKVLDANPALATIFGYEDVQGLLQRPSLTIQTDPYQRYQLLKKRESEGIIQNEAEYRTRDGNLIWVRNTGRVIYDKQGKIEYIGGTIEDITERKTAEKALQESEERFRHVMSSITDYIYVTETTGSGIPDVIFLSPNFEGLTGYPQKRFITDWRFWLSIVIHPEDRVAAGTHMARAMTGRMSEVEYRLIRADGDIIWVRDSVRVETRKTSKVIYGVVSDVTARKQAEEALAAEQERLALTLRSINDGVIAIDVEGRIFLANPVARIYLSVFTTADFGDILTHLGDRSLEEILATSPQTDQAHEIIVEGSPRRIFEVVAQKMDTSRPRHGWVLIIRDVTETRAIQEQVRKRDRLAAVGQLAAGIAHDFNNILTTIIGLSELTAEDPDLPQKTREDMKSITDQGQRAARLTRQILDFGRGTITKKRPIKLDKFLKETIKLLERTTSENIQITVEIEPNEYVVNADPTQIQQVLTNLVINAQDAMLVGGVLRFKLSRRELGSADYSAYPVLKAGDWLILSVSDTGTGIAEKHLPHLFEPFFTTKDVGKGTGLGLAQVYGIVRQHEGYIDVDSQLHAGTTFTLYFPGESLPPKPIPGSTVQMRTPTGRGEVILLVEDDLTVLSVTQSMLKRLGYQILTATNGQQALDVYERHKENISLVLTDITMPEMGGIALCKALRKKNEVIKIVAMSGYPTDVEEGDLAGLGIVSWLAKPLSIDKVAQEISLALSSKDP